MPPSARGFARRLVMLATAIGLGAALGVAAEQVRGGAQQPSPTPIFTPGPVNVIGTVDIGNEPVVSAQQVGPWVVDTRQVGPWTVTVANPVSSVPTFLAPNVAYRFQWPSGDVERYRIISLGTNGWVRAAAFSDTGAPTQIQRWLNATAAVTIEQLE